LTADYTTLGTKVEIAHLMGNRGALLIMIGECKSCVVKHLDWDFIKKCDKSGYKVTFVKTRFYENIPQAKSNAIASSEVFNGYRTTFVNWNIFKNYAYKFVPRLILTDKASKVIAKQDTLRQEITLPQ
jgi:hypothetical protein